MIPRFIHRIWAAMFGYFWLPCPVCGHMFGGHESDGSAVIIDKQMNGSARGRVVCPNCGEAAKQINKQNGFTPKL